METAEIIKDDLIKEILEKAPDENDNAWFLKLSKQSQIDFILNQASDGEVNFNSLKIKTLIETNKILKQWENQNQQKKLRN
ncbi:hypothetical protein [Epilithonimonas tenax]|uniref:hypothetical protein n=1 Tax=Epilithonimonas tenax TaxID=191577 RepID=UPI0003FD4EAD|nr:hypothetical protein [Epilithonimonas tenax]